MKEQAPLLASKTTTRNCLIAWEDYRNFLGDIYGSMFDSTKETLIQFDPNPAPPKVTAMPWLLLLLDEQ